MRKKIGNISKVRDIPKGKKFICMFSGGKDCTLALAKAISNGCIPVALIHCISEPNNRSLFHKQSRIIAQKQADATGIPIHFIDFKWWRNVEKIVNIFQEYKKQGVDFVLYGDLLLEEIAENHNYICELAGLTMCLPLFNLSSEVIMDEIEEYQIKSIITEIDSSILEKDILGKQFDRNLYNYFRNLNIDPFGENGEFHTTAVGSVFFKYEMNYRYEIVSDDHIEIKLFP
ncbi:hypothetical protein JNE33_06335 [Streptococcus suis]|uniref:Dph6-related ATP pyrophosphatase n=1 Tax=Streptococcus suis TaxID=1307 RepID=UPI00192D8385|nr:hypothetical protein [Streptococcus suis]MBL6440125.1 hypothetical protein [Streptococcus suis]